MRLECQGRTGNILVLVRNVLRTFVCLVRAAAGLRLRGNSRVGPEISTSGGGAVSTVSSVSVPQTTIESTMGSLSALSSDRSIDFAAFHDYGDQMLAGGLIQDLFASPPVSDTTFDGITSLGSSSVRVVTSSHTMSSGSLISTSVVPSLATVSSAVRRDTSTSLHNVSGPSSAGLQSRVPDSNALRAYIEDTVHNILRSHPRTPIVESVVVNSASAPPVTSTIPSHSVRLDSESVPGRGMRVVDDNMLGFAGAASWVPTAGGVSHDVSPSVVVRDAGVDSVRPSVAGALGAHVAVPAVPHRFVQRINRGEFIDFDELFSAIVSVHQPRTGYSVRLEDAVELLEEGGGGPILSVRPRRASARIDSFTSWMRAWNEFVAVLSHFRPHLLPQLFRYQAAITRFAARYELEQVLAYDIACRMFLANNQLCSWDSVLDNSELVDIHLRHAPVHREVGIARRVGEGISRRSEQPASRCFRCGLMGHMQRHCSVPQNTQQTSGMSGFRAPQRPVGPCYTFNDWGVCRNTNCPWEHKCSTCRGDHSRSTCNKNVRK